MITLETINRQMERMLDGMEALYGTTRLLVDRLERTERNVLAITDHLGAAPRLDDGPAGQRDPRTAALLERLARV